MLVNIILFNIDVLMVISIMEKLTVFYAKINVMHVRLNLIFAYLVMELIGFPGLYLFMIASKYNCV